MGATSIEWATHTWNPGVYGCEEVSPACAHCYAAKMAHRLSAQGIYPEGITEKRASGVHWSGKVVVADEVRTHDLPVRGPARVFTTSMGDLFHDDVPMHFVVKVFAEMERRPQLDFLVLTKRPEVMAAFGDCFRWPSNVWAGTTVEDQKRADERIPHLLRVQAPIRFLSCEPLLGPIALDYTLFNGADSFGRMPGIHWVIAGGESGQRARPTYPGWFRDLRDQCQRAGVPFFFKQHGEWVARSDAPDAPCPTNPKHWGVIAPGGTFWPGTTPWNGRHNGEDESGEWSIRRAGKARAGRMLDGRTWDKIPVRPS